MDALEAILPLLDIAIMATLSAWFLAFATSRRAAEATAHMLRRAERVRIGALAIAGGMAVDVGSVATGLVFGDTAALVVGFLAYPLWICGAVALASATWAARGSSTSAAEASA